VYSVIDSILASKLKVKSQQICSISDKYIKVNPSTKGALHDSMFKLKNDLANVVVKGLAKVNRAVISKDEKNDKEFKLFVEGEGLREVMGTNGKYRYLIFRFYVLYLDNDTMPKIFFLGEKIYCTKSISCRLNMRVYALKYLFFI
jgi:hypothetical protein